MIRATDILLLASTLLMTTVFIYTTQSTFVNRFQGIENDNLKREVKYMYKEWKEKLYHNYYSLSNQTDPVSLRFFFWPTFQWIPIFTIITISPANLRIYSKLNTSKTTKTSRNYFISLMFAALQVVTIVSTFITVWYLWSVKNNCFKPFWKLTLSH